MSVTPPKKDKFKDLMRSPSGSTEVKEELMNQPPVQVNNSATPFVQIIGKKKATFELDAELHHWLKVHAVKVNKKMVDVVEEVLRQYREEQERDL